MEHKEGLLGYTQEEYGRFRRFGARFLLSFSLLYMSLYCCRLNLSSASIVMIRELGLSKQELGLLNSALFWAYAFGGFINGRLAERFGIYRFIVLSALLSIAANLLFSVQKSLAGMTALWAMNGFFQSMAWAPGVAAIAGWYPRRRRGFATGLANSFSGFGQAAAAAAVSLSYFLCPALGWKAAFLLPPLVTAGMLLIFLSLAKERPESVGLRPYAESEAEESAEGAEERVVLRRIFSNRKFLIWMTIAFLTGLTRYGLIVWIPLYFSDRFAIDVTAGLLQSLALPLGMGAGALLLPALTDRFCPEDRIRAVVIPSLVGAASILGFLFLSPSTAGQMILISLFLFSAGFCIYAINGLTWAYASDFGGRRHSGSCTGLLNLSCYIGAAVQSLVYGFLANRVGWGSVFFSIAVFCALIGLLAVMGREKT